MTYEAYILFFSGFRSNIVSSIKIALSSKKKVWLKNEITVGRDQEVNTQKYKRFIGENNL